MNTARFAYVTYISTTPEKLWHALLDADTTRKYWQMINSNDSGWERGTRWEHLPATGKKTPFLVGKVVESRPKRRLVLTWALPEDEKRREKHSRVTFDIARYRKIVRLTVTHERLEPRSEMLLGISDGWPKVLSSLKSLLETGRPLPKLW
jgi:uncharacterized protein YndB with AHSA1/START domain